MDWREIFPGVSLVFYDIHADHLDYSGAPLDFPADMISIQHCREGRFEGEYPNGECFYLGQGDLSVNLPARSPTRNAFPLSHYHGVNLAVLPGPATASIRELERVLGPMAIDLGGLLARLQTGNGLAVFRSDPSVEHILSELYRGRRPAQESYLKLKTLELLLYLCSADAKPTGDRPYFLREQVRAVKEIRAFLTEHLEERHTLEELSRRFHISLTSLKDCFKGVFGTSPSAYLREYRLQAAAELLEATALPIGEIALRVGYESPSKFAAAFKKRLGRTPGDYRERGAGA